MKFLFKNINGDLSNVKDLEKTFDIYKPQKVVNLAAQAGVRYSLENPSSYSFGGAGFDLAAHTAAAGLNLTSHFLGYHNGSSFQTFMSSSGDFFLGGSTGVFQWDHSAGSLHVSGSLVELNTPKFFFGTATPGE